MDVVGNVSLGDLERAWGAARQLDANPLRLAGRLAGLGSAELDAGIPTWAWMTVAFGAGVLVTVAYGDTIQDKISGLLR